MPLMGVTGYVLLHVMSHESYTTCSEPSVRLPLMSDSFECYPHMVWSCCRAYLSFWELLSALTQPRKSSLPSNRPYV